MGLRQQMKNSGWRSIAAQMKKGRAGVACPLQKVARIGYWPKISVP
jgi:hypothetical protein